MSARDPRMPIRVRERLRAILDSPSRLALIGASALALAAVPLLHGRNAREIGGPIEAIEFVGGVAIFIIALRWRWFWNGVDVRESLIKHYPDLRFHPGVAPVRCPCGCSRSLGAESLAVATAYEHCAALEHSMPAAPDFAELRAEGIELRGSLEDLLHQLLGSGSSSEIWTVVSEFDARVRSALGASPSP